MTPRRSSVTAKSKKKCRVTGMLWAAAAIVLYSKLLPLVNGSEVDGRLCRFLSRGMNRCAARSNTNTWFNQLPFIYAVRLLPRCLRHHILWCLWRGIVSCNTKSELRLVLFLLGCCCWAAAAAFCCLLLLVVYFLNIGYDNILYISVTGITLNCFTGEHQTSRT